MVDFTAFGLPVNMAIFAAAAVAVWIAGTKIAYYADIFSKRWDLDEALLGVFLLAGVTSLPEIATSLTAALADNAALAVNNLLGSIAMQVAVLAVADMIFARRALTSVVPAPVVILQGALNVCLLSFVAIAVIVGDRALFGIGLWSWALMLCSLYAFRQLSQAQGRQPWVANMTDEQKVGPDAPDVHSDSSSRTLVIRTAVAAATILVAGTIVAQSGDAIAQQSGLGASFMGMAFVAIATSLPEASTVFAAVRRGLYTMAISDILGTNILNVTLIFAVDLFAPGEPVLSQVGPFSAVGAMLGVAVTGLFLVGLAERRDKTVFRMGIDSAAVLIVYLGGLCLLFTMRGTS